MTAPRGRGYVPRPSARPAALPSALLSAGGGLADDWLPARTMVVVRYQALGPLEAFSDGASIGLGGPKQRLVLAVLLIRAGRVVSDERLVDELWAEEPPDGARHVIQTYVSELRRVLSDEIVRSGGGYLLDVDEAAVDAYRFQNLASAARARVADAPTAAATMLREGLSLWHGEPYGGVSEAPLVRAEIERLTDLRLTAVEDRVAADLAAGRHAAVAPELAALTREHPFRERLHALQMLALYRSNRQAEALLAYQRARRWLLDELGVDPSPELQRLERQILQQDAELAAPPIVEAPLGPSWPAGAAEPAAIRGFELREPAGSRGARVTYRAYQASSGREVAIAVIRSAIVRDPSFMRAFDERVRAAARLDHPNVVPILDWWRDPDAAFVVTPWIRGGSARRSIEGGPWGLSRTLRILEQCGAAIAAAHRSDLVHGALSASDVLLDPEGNGLLTGFVGADQGSAGRTAETSVGGLGPWLAPEVRRGDAATVRADIWGLGYLAIELLVGTPPEDAQPSAVFDRLRLGLPRDLVAVLAQATAAIATERQERVADLLRDVRRAVGADVVGLALPSEPDPAPRNPFKGLQAFAEADAVDFHGRAALVDRLLESVRAERLVVLAGPSGSGKSSLVQAGLIPALRDPALPGSDRWLMTSMFPGSSPFEELDAALDRVGIRVAGLVRAGAPDVGALLPDGTDLLLVVDQLEELWSMVEDADVRRQFVRALVEAALDPRARCHIVVAVRTDFLDRLLDEPRLSDIVRHALVLVTPPTADELAQAITRPARGVGLEFEPGLVDTIIRDVLDEPGALPLLQHALAELFERREGDRLTSTAYRASGGVTGALARRAEEVLQNLPPGGALVARQVFLRLVSVDEEHDDARRRVPRPELRSLPVSQRLVEEVLQRFGAHRLLAFDRDPISRGPTVEVAHEALFREWPTLHGWIAARRDDLLRHRSVRAAALDWQTADESADYLFTGARLEEVERWQHETDLGLTDAERRFLGASRHRADETQATRRRWRRVLRIATGAAAVVAATLVLIALVQLGRAEAGEREAQVLALAAASGSQLAIDQDLAVLLAAKAVDLSDGGQDPIPEAVDALHEALAEHRTVASTDVGGFFVAFGADDRMFSTGGPPGPQHLPVIWSSATGDAIVELEPGGARPTGGAVSVDGRFGAETYADGPTVVWDLGTGAVVARLGADGPFGAPAISPDGRLVAHARPDFSGARSTVEVFDLATQRLLASIPAGPVTALAFGRRGTWLAIASDAPPQVTLVEPATGRTLRQVAHLDPPSGVAAIAYAPAVDRLALLTYSPSRIELLDLGADETVGLFTIGAEPNAVCFLGDGRWVVATAADQLTHVFDVATGFLAMTLPGSPHLGGLACEPDGTRLAIHGEGGLTRMYDLAPAATAEVRSFAIGEPDSGWWLSDGTLLVGEATELRRYSPSGDLLARTPDAWQLTPQWNALSTDGRLIAVEAARAGDDEEPRAAVFDATTLQLVRRMSGPGLPLAFSHDDRLLLTGGADGGAIYDLATGARIAALRSPLGDGAFMASSGTFLDPTRIAVQSVAAPEAWIFEASTGERLGTICSVEESLRIGLDPSGQTLVVGDHPGWVERWPLGEAVAVAMGAPATCSRDVSNPTDAARTDRWPQPASGGLRFSPDGRLLASTSGFSGELMVSDVVDGATRLEMVLPATVSILGFSADGRHLAIALYEPRSGLHSVRILAIDPAELVEIARSRVSRALTTDECAAYRIDPCG